MREEGAIRRGGVRGKSGVEDEGKQGHRVVGNKMNGKREEVGGAPLEFKER